MHMKFKTYQRLFYINISVYLLAGTEDIFITIYNNKKVDYCTFFNLICFRLLYSHQ